jgi:hypothetical protein
MKSLRWFACSLMGFGFAIVLAGCGSNQTVMQPVVTMATAPASVQPGMAAQFSATVSNDSSNLGINWAVTCLVAPCGSVAPTNTKSGQSTTYTAPTIPPAGDLTVTITATAAAGGGVPVSANFTVPGIKVNVSAPSVTMLQVNGTSQVTATATGDTAANPEVTWTVSCAVLACGSISPTPTPSGVATTYTAPSTPPAGNLIVTITAASMTNPGATGSTTVTVLGITISIAPTSTSVESAGTQKFTATVANDPVNGGVNWSLEYSTTFCRFRCGTTFHPCGSVCGAVSPLATANGVTMTFTAPNTPPRLSGSSPRGPYLVATSVTTPSALKRELIAVLAIGISVSTTPANVGTVALNAAQPLMATVTNDGANSGAGAGVTWTLKQNGVACSPGCGTITPPNTLSGAPAIYTAPAMVPGYPLLTITATSVTDTTKSASVTITVTTASGAACGAGSGSESLLNGHYAFRLQGFLPGGFVALTGSFTADGTGKFTAGELDSASSGAQPIDTTKSFYWVGNDHRGCMTFGGTIYYRFALGSINSSNIATAGHIIEFDDTTGTSSGVGLRVAGTLKLQDAASFFASKFKGNYVIGLAGGYGNGRSAVAGTFTSDGVSLITTSNLDFNGAGTITSNIPSAPGGSFTCCDTYGRGTLQLTGGSFTINLVLYMVNSSDVLFEDTGGIFSGEAIGVPTGTAFTQASLNGAAVIRKTAQSTTGPVVDVALASANGTGGINITDNTNNSGTFSSSTTQLTYTVASNGRVTLMGGTTPPVLYLYGPNAGFLVGTGPSVEFGIIEPQAAGPFNLTSLSGGYMFGSENPSDVTVALETGVATLDGAGKVAGTTDQSSSAGLAQNQITNLTYSVTADGAGTFGTGTTAILISGSKLVFINNTSAAPTITVVEK